tara:strand:- start:8618 stop:9109 length:492 start_codon:yes stop_codon:yes gene_type:complete
MANSKLKGVTIFIEKDVNHHLKRIFNAYCGDRNIEGYTRLKNLCDSKEISYEQLARIKNFFDNFTGKKSDSPYLLNGGTKMKDWVEMSLSNMRDGVENNKKTMSNIGMPNRYQKEKLSISGVKLDNHDSDTNKILRHEGIYSIKVMEDLITIIDKNKQLCHIS